MGALKNILIGVLIISIITFVALFGRLPAFRKGPIGVLHRLLWNVLPAALCTLDDHLSGGRVASSLRRLGYYLMNENHPLILIFFLGVLLGSQLLFLPKAFARLNSFHRVIATTLSIIPHILIYKTVTSTSSYISPRNHWQYMRQYPYDHVLYQPGQFCRTCHFLKPARSKHCSICKVCVAKHDHHCVWVMNCLGKGNYAYFIAMLFSISSLLSYGGYLAYLLLTETLQSFVVRRSQGIEARQHWSAGRTWSQYFEGWAWAIARDIRIGGVGMLAVLTAPLAWGLFLYHLYLIWAGMTTNESSKWADWKDDIADGLVYRSERFVGDRTSCQQDPEVEPFVEWPISSNQRLVKYEDGVSPAGQLDNAESSATSPTRGNVSSTPSWKRLHDLHEVDNLYDLGFWDNLLDIIPFTTSLIH